MPRQYRHGGRVDPRPAGRAGAPVDGPAPRTLRQRFSALGGTRDELVAQRGRYAELFDLQAAGLR